MNTDLPQLEQTIIEIACQELVEAGQPSQNSLSCYVASFESTHLA